MQTLLCALVVLAASLVFGHGASSFPAQLAVSLGSAPCMAAFESTRQRLVASTDMGAHTAQLLLSLPFEMFASFLMQPAMLPMWNRDYSAYGGPAKFIPCTPFGAKFTTKFNVTMPSDWRFLPPMLLTANRTDDVAVFGWSFEVVSGDGSTMEWGAHWMGAFRVVVDGMPMTQFVTWQKIAGDFVRRNRAAFEFGLSRTVLQQDVTGALCLDQVYQRTGALNVDDVRVACANAQ